MKKNKLKEINGTIIRWQYFTVPIIILLFCMLFVPYCMLIFTLGDNSFEWSKWLSDLLISVEVGVCFAIPFIILSVLNRHFFGKIICVINEYGIHHKDGLTKWNEITKIEYEIEWPGGTVAKQYRYCRAIIYTKNDNVVLPHAPMYVLSNVMKYSPSTTARVSKNSKWVVGFFIVILVVAVPLIPLFT